MITPQNSALAWRTYHEVFVYSLAGEYLRKNWHAVPYRRYAMLLTAERAFGNIKLALETDEQEARELATNPDLAGALFEAGACWRGLSEVGLQAEDWYDLGVRIAKADRDDWLVWIRECEHDEVEVQAVEDGYFSAGGYEPDEEYEDEDD